MRGFAQRTKETIFSISLWKNKERETSFLWETNKSYISWVLILVNPIQTACSFPSAIIAFYLLQNNKVKK